MCVKCTEIASTSKCTGYIIIFLTDITKATVFKYSQQKQRKRYHVFITQNDDNVDFNTHSRDMRHPHLLNITEQCPIHTSLALQLMHPFNKTLNAHHLKTSSSINNLTLGKFIQHHHSQSCSCPHKFILAHTTTKIKLRNKKEYFRHHQYNSNNYPAISHFHLCRNVTRKKCAL